MSDNRQAMLEIVVRSLLTTLIDRSDMPSNSWSMLRDQALLAVGKDVTSDAELRVRLRANIEEFFQDVARDAGLGTD